MSDTIAETRMYVPNKREMLDVACRCCGETTVRLVIDLGDQPQANRLVRPETPAGAEPTYPLRLGCCETCTLLQIDHTIPRDDVFRDYVYVSGTTETLAKHFQETTDRLRETYGVDASNLVVDIGSNDGTWLKTWGKWQRVCGVEPAHDIAAAANDDGVRTLNQYFDLDTALNIRKTYGAAKLITSAGSFFHMEDLHGACEGVRELLADAGVFVCQAISANDMINGNAFDQVLHEHLCYYSVVSFYELMRRHGMVVFHVEHHPIHGGTNEYHVCREGQRNPDNTVFRPHLGASWMDCEAFARRVLGLREHLMRVLEAYKQIGRTVWAYGAPGKGGTLLNSFGIGRDLIPYAVEKNPRKFGLSIPGCRIPIIPENVVRASEGGPDAYLVLAWNFLDEFIAKERDWLEAGGEFIVPVPEVRIITGEDV